MLSSIRRVLSDLRYNKSGNALLLVALGMPVLIGTSGLAVDSAQYYMWKRDLQVAADSAALAGAWARTTTATQSTYQARALQEYNANVQVTKGIDTGPTTSLVNYNGGTANAVKVVASATKLLPFSNIITGQPVTVTVQAIASAVPAGAAVTTTTTQNVLTACMIALDPSAAGAFTIGGNASGSVGCGGAALSSDPSAAIRENGNPSAQFGQLVATGGIETSLLNNVGGDSTKLKSNTVGLSDPFSGLAQPTGNGISRTYACNNGTASPQPGTYTNIMIGCTTTFQPGIYVINGTIDFGNNKTVTGTDVLFVMTTANQIANINSKTNIALSGIKASTLMSTYGYSAASAAKLAGMLFYDTQSTSQIKFNGNSTTNFNGIFYMPNRSLWFNGSSAVSGACMMLVARTLMLDGTTDLSSFCQSNNANSLTVRPQIDTTTTTAGTAAVVKLVG